MTDPIDLARKLGLPTTPESVARMEADLAEIDRYTDHRPDTDGDDQPNK